MLSYICCLENRLNKENAILYKLRQIVNRKTLKEIYHAIFDPHLHHSSLV